MVALGCALTTGAGWNAPPASAAEQKQADNSVTGTFVSASGDTFKIKDDAGLEHSLTLAADGKVMDAQGQEIELSDLKANQKVQVTKSADDPKAAKEVKVLS
jgi:hypothetical protein